MKKWLLGLLNVWALGAWAQSEVDSLLKQLPQAQENQRIEVLSALTEALAYRNADSARMFGLEALEMVPSEDAVQRYELLHNIAITYQVQSRYEEALQYSEESLRLAESFPDSIEKANIINNIGLIYDEQGLYEEAVRYYQHALALYQAADKPDKVALVNVNLGVVYKALGDYEESIRNYQDALKIFKKMDDTYLVAVCEVNLGSVYLFVYQYDSALQYGQLAAEKFQSLGYLRFEAVAIGNVGIAYAKLQQNDLAKTYLTKAIALHEQNANTKELAFCKLKLAEVYEVEGNYEQALRKAMEASALAEQAQAMQQIADAHALLARLYQAQGDYVKAFAYLQSYQAVHDTLFERNSLSEIRKFQIQYETEKKERALATSKAELAEKELEIQQSNTRLIVLGAALLLVLMLGLGFYRNQKMRQAQLEQENILKEQLAKAEAQNALQQERLRISRDLHDNIGSQLTFINASMESLSKQVADPSVSEVKHLTLETIKELRKTVWLINKQSVSWEEFVIKLRDYLKPVAATATQLEVKVNGGLSGMLEAQEANQLFRLLQEAVNNALKHAQASEIEVAFEAGESGMSVSVKDNGQGFDPQQVAQKSMGLQSMEARANSLQAQWFLHSEPGHGTQIRLLLAAPVRV
ncbi:tetratricopeptide repeat protein [Cytophagales bacterium LB-30]|uniref:histidine kinase n=1 Tax=Shiella aurantiaca TaxID=3058365 RepID=A0ABT8F8E7_9BACT|nr:tetratricopeptide repeat protein [Shiella aurantiaca]MDN4166481.1 tetratricopeptide repeat protein [Shiella aurantiaca]